MLSQVMKIVDSSATRRNIHVTVLAIVVILILIITIVLLFTVVPKYKLPDGEKDRIECPGFSSRHRCKKYGCIYEPVRNGPTCYMAKNAFGYLVDASENRQTGPVAQLQMTSEKTPYGHSFPKAVFQVEYITEYIVRFKINDLDQSKPRYEVPVQKDFPLLVNRPTVDVNSLSYSVTVSGVGEIFSFAITRRDGVKVWDSSIGGLVLSDQFLQIASYLPSSNVFGLGEHVHETFKHDMNFRTWPIFTKDEPPDKAYKNLYSAHPFYTCLEKSGKSHGVLFLNSNAMEVTLMPAPAISFRTIGGILDFFVFIGQSPEHVVQLYTSLIGRPMMPPYWGLGFQLSRYGYGTLQNVANVIERTRAAGIVQDVQYLDIDHMDANKDFTFDNFTFAGLPDYIRRTKQQNGLRWIVILDPAISSAPNYAPYLRGVQQGAFIKSAPEWDKNMFPVEVQSLNLTIGRVWPVEPAAFPDFLRDPGRKWWREEIVAYRGTIEFDGLWIDMNEPANFGTNEKTPFYCEFQNPMDCWALHCPRGTYDDPPYNPVEKAGSKRLSDKTICMESVQGDTNQFLHYDVHSLYGWSQAKPTFYANTQATGQRPLVISRSTYPSSGAYAGHWLGDNKSQWKDLHRSIIGMLEFNLFGIPYIGADVCGYFDHTSPALCKRWMQLGAFYPFFRNHNGIDENEQDPVVLGGEVLDASKSAIQRRYNLNPYLYTLFYRAHVDGSTVVRPLFHEFVNDEIALNVDRQFLWGRSLLISPVITEGENSIALYLPYDEWWHFNYKQSRVEKFYGQYIIKSEIDTYIPLHVRGGSIIPTELYLMKSSVNIPAAKNFTLYVFPKSQQSTGEMFIDDGQSANTIENGNYVLFQFKQEKCALSITPQKGPANYTGPAPILNEVIVFKAANVQEAKSGETAISFSFNPQYSALTLIVNNDMNNVNSITWGTAGTCNMPP